MSLTFEEIKDVYNNVGSIEQTNKATIQKAIKHEERVRFHSEVSLDKEEVTRAYNNFINLVGELLPDDKLQMFKTLFQFPVATVPLLDEIYTALRKLFDGRNPVYSYDFVTKELENDWREYRDVKLSDKFWEDEGFEMMKSGINSLVVVDLPSEQTGDRPEPYAYFIELKDVIALQDIEGVDIEWVIFKIDKDRIGVFDDEYYRVFKVKGGRIIDIEIESTHDLGFCPVRFFWTSGINNKLPLVKKSPISTYLGRLDMLLFYEISNEHLNLFARFPIYSAYEEDCSYEMKETGYYCSRGVLKTRNGEYVFDGTKPKSCPVCSTKKFDGAGTYIKIEAPSRKNNNADLSDPVTITTIPKDSLDYNNNDIKERRMEVYRAMTGNKGMSINNKAVNEKQVLAIFESLEAALRMPQQNFEAVMEWVDNTCCLLRYGKEVYKGASINLGTDHYVMSSSQLLDLYLQNKERGAGAGVLDMWEDRYYESEYRNDQVKMARYSIISNLDPLRHTTNAEALVMSKEGKIDNTTYLIKTNLSSFILRFERENDISIVEFGKNDNFGNKIDTIKQSFVNYANEMQVMEEINL